MTEKIQPFLQEIVTKEISNGDTIYSCLPKRGIRIMSTGYERTEREAIEAFFNELVKKGYIDDRKDFITS